MVYSGVDSSDSHNESEDKLAMSFEWIRCLEDTLGFLILMSILHALKMKKRNLFLNGLDVHITHLVLHAKFSSAVIFRAV